MSEERPPTDIQTPPGGPTPPEPPGAAGSLLSHLQEVVGDSYRVDREISGGGMSRLFLATEVSLGRQVVIKILPPDFANAMSAARFKREIELTAHMQHPHIL